MMFGSRSVLLHLGRGVVGFGALGLALSGAGSPWLSLALVPVALFALKGCPICWTMGLLETVTMRVHLRHDATSPQRNSVLTAPR